MASEKNAEREIPKVPNRYWYLTITKREIPKADFFTDFTNAAIQTITRAKIITKANKIRGGDSRE